MKIMYRLLITMFAVAMTACSSLPSYTKMAKALRSPLSPTVSTYVVAAPVPTYSANQVNISSSKLIDSTQKPVLAPMDEAPPAQYTTNEDLQEAAGRPIDPEQPNTVFVLNEQVASSNLWDELRQGFALPTFESTLVSEHEQYYASRPDYVQRMTMRGSRYLYHVLKEVQQRGMPSELALLPFIESAFNPGAISSARASGIWQFMPATGRDFALKQNLFRDDRRDVLASTRAALDYLTRLHRQFGDWHLALAAYNWGEGNVQRAINRNSSMGMPTDYLSLSMPAETRNYVPKLYAVRHLVSNPQRFGINLTPIANHPYFLSVPIQRDMDVAMAVRLAEMHIDDFKAINPSMNKPVILASGTPQILLPYDNAQVFLKNLKQFKGQLASWTAWVAPKTMRTVEAAKYVGVDVSQLRTLNNIPKNMLIKAGSTLLVPRNEQMTHDVSATIADNASLSFTPDVPPVKRLLLRAGKRDTVASIAKRYRLPATQVAKWNKVAVSSRFKRSQAIVVYVPYSTQLAKAGKVNPSQQKIRVSQNKAKSKMKGKPKTLAKSSSRNIKVAGKAKPSVRQQRRTQALVNAGGKRVRVAMASH